MPDITATFFESVRDNVPQPVELSFRDLADIMAASSIIPVHRADKKTVRCVVPARFAPLRRASANVVEVFAFFGDVDGGKPGDPGFDGMVSWLDDLGLAYIVHSTTKSRVSANRYRVILPYACALTAADGESAWSSIHQMFGSIFDTGTFDAGRLNILPWAWLGAPEDCPDWDEADAHHGFRYRDGVPLDAHAVMSAHPPVLAHTRQEEDEATLTAILGQAAVHVDFAQLTDLDRSPLVTPDMVTEYLTSPQGGRFYRFMCRAAGRALTKGVNCDEDIILALGMAMNRRADNRRRTSARREARRALNYAASRHAMQPDFRPQTHDDNLNREIERLRRRKG